MVSSDALDGPSVATILVMCVRRMKSLSTLSRRSAMYANDRAVFKGRGLSHSLQGFLDTPPKPHPCDDQVGTGIAS